MILNIKIQNHFDFSTFHVHAKNRFFCTFSFFFDLFAMGNIIGKSQINEQTLHQYFHVWVLIETI
jgi:hypothetical protein